MQKPFSGRLVLLQPLPEAPPDGIVADFSTADLAQLLQALSGRFSLAAPDCAPVPENLCPGFTLEYFPEWLPAGQAAQLGLSGKVLAEGLRADVFICASCGSTFDVAWRLRRGGFLPEWGAVLALRQSSGRGQLRRPWHSPAGNLYVSFRLPRFFAEQAAASVLTALLLIEAFKLLDLRLWLKWPNDLALARPDRFSADDAAGGKPGAFQQPEAGEKYGKLGGILLEEREDVLLAGVGINCASMPAADSLRRDAAMPAAVLPADFTWKNPCILWLELVSRIILVYEKTFAAAAVRQLLRQSEQYLLWKGSEVQVRDSNEHDSAFSGILSGLTELGGLRLLVESDLAPPFAYLREITLYSGSIKAAD